ncbi:hypothetical protein [Methylobacterium gnaphalii]|uniref:Lipoprotein n=1 Tax=Methylobacterium gnaphalii TaxID=1010610 RepID=A0A512JFJ5_9HYPH|nr:hypothetical protein [Methylobacterium gnaphalii]GEP08717.1 hypothetical protein MGN01_05620 [Methylobacterium gnaphalii]GJD69307.1 hypothetical protein MMMDOFMJ_2237 [Methylobacterium gnaphalii]
MASKVSFHWLLTLLALVVPSALGPCRSAKDSEAAATAQPAASDVVFRHYL